MSPGAVPAPALRSVLAFLAGFGLVLSAAQGSLQALVGPEASLHESVNALRREHHLLPLAGSPELGRVALSHAKDMAHNGYLAHIDPRGRTPLERVRSAGVTGFRLLAENIGSSNVTGDRVPAIIEAWLDSTSHRENLLNPAFNTSGVGVAHTSDGRTIVVQLYATFPRESR